LAGNKRTEKAKDKGLPEAAGSGPLCALSSLWSRLYELPYWARETIRKTLHIGVCVLALPLRWFGWWYGIAFAVAALLWNAFGMPRFFRFTFREDEHRAGFSQGMLTYPVSVFLLMILFPLPIAASQWATLSFGDGFATLVGKFFGKRALPWNRDKTFEGMGAFLVMGTSGAFFFFLFTMGNTGASSFIWQGSSLVDSIISMTVWEVAAVCLVSTAAAATAESIPLPWIDDNMAAPLAGAAAKLIMCYAL